MSRRQVKYPNIAHLILRTFGRYQRDFEFNADIEEEYLEKSQNAGPLKAKIWFWKQALRTIPAYLKYRNFWSLLMFKNYLKIAFRNIQRRKLYSSINIFGLALGYTISILIMFWVKDEMGYDKFHENHESIYRVIVQEKYQGEERYIPRTVGALRSASKAEIPEVLYSTRTHMSSGRIINYGTKIFSEDEFMLADSDFFTIFSFKLQKGDPASVLENLNSIVISKESAYKYFGDEDPLGKVLNVDNRFDYVVTGVLDEIPGNSHLQFDFIINAENIDTFLPGEGYGNNWRVGAFSTYLLLANGSKKQQVQLKIDALYHKNSENENAAMILQPLKDIHFYDISGTIVLSGSSAIKYVYIFSCIAALVLFIACINFMNLTTAQSENRSREVGLRKVSGAHRDQLIFQYLSEAVIFSFLALLTALFLVYLILPVFNDLSGKELQVLRTGNFDILFLIIALTIFTGLFSGIYPAFFLSSFHPVVVLKGINDPAGKSVLLRKGLVVGQFILSIALIVFTVIVHKQLYFMQNKDPGYLKEKILYLDLSSSAGQNYDTFKNELLKNSKILQVTASSNLPTRGILATVGVDWDGKSTDEQIMMEFSSIDYDYIETYGLDVLEGNSFQEEFMDREYFSLIMNKKARDITGYDTPVGKLISFGRNQGRILGIVDNYHFESLHAEIKPLILVSIPAYFRYIHVKMRPDVEEMRSVIDYIENIWISLNPESPFEYHFLDETFNLQYSFEQRFGRIFNYASILTILISAFGLFGLISYTAERKTKEIGIRKTLGASVKDIMFNLSKEFILLVFTANIISWPIAYHLGNKWLDGFAYRTEIEIWLFLVSGSAALTIALITISYHIVKASLRNPVDSLKHE